MKATHQSHYCCRRFGTRFLPQTKTMPKEMLPIVGRALVDSKQGSAFRKYLAKRLQQLESSLHQ